jgi:hypothetical protein
MTYTGRIIDMLYILERLGLIGHCVFVRVMLALERERAR